jgi:hypothetical protein
VHSFRDFRKGKYYPYKMIDSAKMGELKEITKGKSGTH